jgi:multiple sugar transport system substrate-binding protein
LVILQVLQNAPHLVFFSGSCPESEVSGQSILIFSLSWRGLTMKKYLVVLFLLFVCLFVSCSGKSEAAKSKPVSIRVVVGNHAWTTSMKPYLPEFEASTGIKVVLEEYEINQVTEKTSIELSAKSPTLDVMFVRPQSELLTDVKNGWLEPIDNFIANSPEFDVQDIMPAARDTFTLNSKLYGIPICTERQLLYYRKDLFEAKGVKVPTTMDELYEAAGKLHDPANGIYGFIHRSRVGMTQIVSFLYSFGGGYQDANWNSSLNTPETVAGFSFYGKILHDYGPPKPETLNYLEMFALFAQGKGAMISDVDANYLLLAAPQATEYSNVIGYAPFPAGPAGSRPINSCSFGLSISAFSKNKEAAWEFVKWATGKDINNRIQANGAPTARKSAYSNPDFNKNWPKELVDVNMAILNGSGGVGVDRPRTFNYNEVRDIIYEVIYKIIQKGGKDIQADLDEANMRVQAIYDEYNK